ncbi:MAG: hypothetical protein WDN28_07350 [Chthoniobacter sp.]
MKVSWAKSGGFFHSGVPVLCEAISRAVLDRAGVHHVSAFGVIDRSFAIAAPPLGVAEAGGEHEERDQQEQRATAGQGHLTSSGVEAGAGLPDGSSISSRSCSAARETRRVFQGEDHFALRRRIADRVEQMGKSNGATAGQGHLTSSEGGGRCGLA